MLDDPKSVPELRGWKQIGGYLKISVRTAQKFERDKGLPVHREGSGAKSPVYAIPAELDAWRYSSTPPESAGGESPRLESVVNRRHWLGYGLSGLAVLGLGALGLTRLMRGNRRHPATYRIEGATLVVLAGDGSTLWRHAFPLELDPVVYKPGHPMCIFADLNGNGERKTVFYYCPAKPVDRRLICFGEDGTRCWEFLPRGTVQDNLGRRFQPPYWPSSFEVLQSKKPRSSRIVVSSSHEFSFDAQIAVLDGATGKVLSEYWHRGHLYRMAVIDIDGDGEPEVLLGGVNDAPEYKQATLVVFDHRRISGATRNPRGGLYFQGMPPGSEKCVVFFPRTKINTDKEFNIVAEVRADPDGITVIVAEGTLSTDPQVVYKFDRTLRLIQVMLSNEALEVYEQLQQLGKLTREPAEVIAEDLKNRVSVVRYTAESWGDTSAS